MSIQSILVLSDTGTELNVTSDKVRADGWFGAHDGLHTIAFFLSNFTGRIFLEATLATEPETTDWFPVVLDGTKAYVEYPLAPPLNSAFNSVDPTGGDGSTFVDAFTLQGNFLWLRVRIDRSYIKPVPTTDSEKALLGSVRKVLLNH